MTNRNQLFRFPSLILLMCSMATVFAQGQQTFRETGNVTISIAGTSTLHNWEMTSSAGNCQAVFTVGRDGKLEAVHSASFSTPAESLKSGKGPMDHNAYKALKTNQFKDISFRLANGEVNGKTIRCKGDLTIAGNTKHVDLEADWILNEKSTVLRLVKTIRMTDFEVEPPSFMFGTVTTGDEITIDIRLILAPVEA
ncbi:MAG: YceI family protein [Bacteroidota bacterium]